jgi:hypothetical protein
MAKRARGKCPHGSTNPWHCRTPEIVNGPPPPGPAQERESVNDRWVRLAMALQPDQHFLVPMDVDLARTASYVQRRIDNLSSLLRRRVRKFRKDVKIVVRRSGPSDLAVWCQKRDK